MRFPGRADVGIYAIKPWFRTRLTGVADGLIRRRVTPDQVTAFGVVASAVGGVFVWLGDGAALLWLAVPLCAFLRIAANALDGLVAQRAGLARPQGELFNETADRLGDVAFLAPVALIGGVPGALPLAALAAAALASFVGITARAAGGTRRYDGPMGKPDRMAVVGLAAIVAAFAGRPDVVWEVAMGVVLGGALLTAANRYRRAHRELGGA